MPTLLELFILFFLSFMSVFLGWRYFSQKDRELIIKELKREQEELRALEKIRDDVTQAPLADLVRDANDRERQGE